MDKKKFINRVREGRAEFRVDDIEISFGDTSLSGSGILEFAHRKFRLRVRLPDGISAPAAIEGVFTSKDFGTLKGTIEHDLPFRINKLPPHDSHNLHNGKITLTYGIDTIEFSPRGLDTQTYDQIRQTLAMLASSEKTENGKTAKAKAEPDREIQAQPKQASAVSFSGLLCGYELIARNAGTTIEETNDFLGTQTVSQSDTQYGSLSEDWEYGLIERGKDLEFHLRLKSGRVSNNPDEDLLSLTAFLQSVAFIHGQHAWPFTLEFRRDGRLITDSARSPNAGKSSPHQPFNERLWFNAKVGNVDWDFDVALQKAYALLRQQNPLSAEVAELLFLCREAAGDGVHPKITNIALCSLLDSAVNLVFEHCKRNKGPEAESFGSVRSDILTFIETGIGSAAKATLAAWHRFKSIVMNSDYFSAREKFRVVGEDLGLNWEGDWEEVFRFWAKWRPKLLHRGTAKSEDARAIADEFNIGSRVVGAIHMLVLKLTGYEGLMISSTFEGKIRKI